MTYSKVSQSARVCSALCQRGDGPFTVEIIIHPTRRPDLFAVTLGSQILVKGSRQPRCDAARALHDLGFPDDTLLVSHKEGSKAEHSMRGPLGEWRKLRIREDRNGPRFAKYEPFTSARFSKKKAKRSSLPDQGTTAQGDEPGRNQTCRHNRDKRKCPGCPREDVPTYGNMEKSSDR
jgi:hypothetical protein